MRWWGNLLVKLRPNYNWFFVSRDEGSNNEELLLVVSLIYASWHPIPLSHPISIIAWQGKLLVSGLPIHLRSKHDHEVEAPSMESQFTKKIMSLGPRYWPKTFFIYLIFLCMCFTHLYGTLISKWLTLWSL